jgi:hypothetical protein
MGKFLQVFKPRKGGVNIEDREEYRHIVSGLNYDEQGKLVTDDWTPVLGIVGILLMTGICCLAARSFG